MTILEFYLISHSQYILKDIFSSLYHIKQGQSVDLGKWASRKCLGGVLEGEVIIRIHCIKIYIN